MAAVAEEGQGMFVLMETDIPKDKEKDRKSNKNRTTVENNGLLTPDPTPEADAARNAVDQVRWEKERETRGQASPDGNSGGDKRGNKHDENPSKLTKEEEEEINWVKGLGNNYAKIVNMKKEPDGTYNEKKLKNHYIKKVPLVSKRSKAFKKLIEAYKQLGLSSAWIEKENGRKGYKVNDDPENGEDEDKDEYNDEDEDSDPQVFRNAMYEKAMLDVLKLIGGNDSPKVINAIRKVNQEIAHWWNGDENRRELVQLVNYVALCLIIAQALNYLKLLETTLDDLAASQGFDKADRELRALLHERSYPETWVLEKPPPIPPQNINKPITKPTTETDAESDMESETETDTEMATDPYALNKANKGKPGYTDEGEKICSHKWVHYKKGDNKGKLKSGQLIVATGPQAFPHFKTLPRTDFTKKTINAYLSCDHATLVIHLKEGEVVEGEFLEIIHTASEYSRPEAMKAPCIISCCKRKGLKDIWVIRKDLQEWCESKRGADKMLQAFMRKEKKEREAYYAAHGIEVEQEQDERDRREERRVCKFGRVTKSMEAGIKAGVFPYFNASTASKANPTATKVNQTATNVNQTAMKVNQTAMKVNQTETKPNQILPTQGFDPTSFPSFSAWYENKHKVKLGDDIAVLTKVMEAFKTIQEALSM